MITNIDKYIDKNDDDDDDDVYDVDDDGDVNGNAMCQICYVIKRDVNSI